VNSTLNNNEVIRAVDEFVETYGSQLEQSRQAIPRCAVTMA
jgi:hypothetical protein